MGGNVQPSLDNAEHIGSATGDNIEAKRVQLYGYDSGNSVSRRVSVDASGNLATSGGSAGTQYTQGGATVANPTGTAEIWFDASGNPKAITPSQPLPSNITDGTNTANILKSDGTAAGQNAQLVSGTGYSTATLTLNSGSPATAWFDMLNYSSYSVEILTNTTPATLTFQTSGDASQTNIRNALFFDSQSNNGAGASSTTSANGTVYGGKTGRYFRISSTNGAGTTTLVITFYTNASPFPFIGGSVSVNSTIGGGTTGSAVPTTAVYAAISDGTNLRGVLGAANALNSTGTGIPTAQLVAQLDDTSPTTITENQFGNLRMDSGRQLRVNNQLSPDATVLNPYSVHLTTNTTTTPTSSTAYISTIAISVEVVGTTSTVTIQDKQGTPLKLVPGIITTATGLTVYNFQTPVKMTSGIDIITAGAVAATIDVWIDYYQ